VDDHITALDARVAVAAGGPASHLDPGHRRAQHEMRVVEVDKIIAEIIFEKGRLFIGARFSDSADRRVAASRALFEENRDAAVLEVAALVANRPPGKSNDFSRASAPLVPGD